MICASCNGTYDVGLRCQCDLLHCSSCFAVHVCPQPLWWTQEKAIAESEQAERDGFRSICITAPTGGGKRRVLTEMAKQTAIEGGKALIFSNRRIITRQTTDELARHGLDHSMIAAGYKTEECGNITVASIQTIWRRRANIYLPPGDRVFIDEAHNKGLHWVVPEYLNRGAKVYLLTATPVGLTGVAEKLIVAGKNSDLFKMGKLVKCRCYSPETPGIKGVRRWKIGKRFSEKHRKWFNEYRTEIFSNVFKELGLVNPFMMPTIIFAPGVAESRWLVDEFNARGVAAAHIDGSTSEKERTDIENGSRDGAIKVVSSCGVMREGADWGWLRFAVGIQAWVGLSTYIQSIGRILRAWEGKNEAAFLDFSGAYWRHGSPNEDREWRLEDTDVTIARRRFQAFKEGKQPEPIRCPKCGTERLSGPKCLCGYVHEKSTRLIRMGSGKLVKVMGEIALKPKPKKYTPDQIWEQCLYACGRSGRTNAQLAGMFKGRSGGWPQDNLYPRPVRPKSVEWFRLVADVYPKYGPKQKVTA